MRVFSLTQPEHPCYTIPSSPQQNTMTQPSLEENIATIRTLLETHVAAQEKCNDRFERHFEDHERRIRATETTAAKLITMIGGSAGIGAFVGAITSAIK